MTTQTEAIRILKAHSEGITCLEDLSDIHFEFVNFKDYDFNNLHLLGTIFEFCVLDNVYLSGTNLGGASFINSRLKNNKIVKAEWNNLIIHNSNLEHIFNFRTDMIQSDISNTSFKHSVFGKMSFSNSSLKNVIFDHCMFSGVDFNDCNMDNVSFVSCSCRASDHETILKYIIGSTVKEINSKVITATSVDELLEYWNNYDSSCCKHRD